MTWTREQLDRGGCEISGCSNGGPLYFHARCHMETRLAYKLLIKGSDAPTLSMACGDCGAHAGEVALDLRYVR